MKKIRFALFALLGITVMPPVVYSQPALYSGKNFSVHSDSVVQGNFNAKAHSNSEISSNYMSDFRKQTRRDAAFKFCLNGLDNERMPGQDHHIILIPRHGKFTTPVYEFGGNDPEQKTDSLAAVSPFLEEDVDVLFRVDMKKVLKEFSSKGYFETFNGEKISASAYKGVFLAGDALPLTWNFAVLGANSAMQLLDNDGDGIYEVTIHIKKETFPGHYAEQERRWKLSANTSAFPQYESSQKLINALYNLSLEEMMLNIRSDGALMAGESWTGVWTRDISYSIILSLAIINPDASKTSLMAKVKNGRIIQDTGTGGSWPVSTDRMVWGLAAWEIYLVTGDQEWLKQSYEIIKASAEDDLQTAYDPQAKLFNGESSFLDWREQTYPRWMDPKDIYRSKNLGTNIVHYQTYRILSEMENMLGKQSNRFDAIAQEIQQSINTKLWNAEKKYYGQYLYGRAYPVLSERSEALGEALAVLYNVADEKRQRQIIANVPVTEFGIPCIYPQIPNIPPYHNNAIWPFVETYWAWASAKTGNVTSVSKSLGSIYRSASLFLTNKENFVSNTGDFLGTEINSNRQLWSVAGTLASVYRVLFGMNFQKNKLVFTPFIPAEYAGEKHLKNFRYRNSILDITLRGTGNTVSTVKLDGKIVKKAEIEADLKGKHTVEIAISENFNTDTIHTVEYTVTPETPKVHNDDKKIVWNDIEDAVRYDIYKNGKLLTSLKETVYTVPQSYQYDEYQVSAVNSRQYASFLSEPVAVVSPKNVQTVSTTEDGSEFILIEKNTKTVIAKTVTIPSAGQYLIDVQYANGNGPINTDNKCAVRTLRVDQKNIGVIVMPQRGANNWSEYGYSSALSVTLSQGVHELSLVFSDSDNNMNDDVNSARIKQFRLIQKKLSVK